MLGSFVSITTLLAERPLSREPISIWDPPKTLAVILSCLSIWQGGVIPRLRNE